MKGLGGRRVGNWQFKVCKELEYKRIRWEGAKVCECTRMAALNERVYYLSSFETVSLMLLFSLHNGFKELSIYLSVKRFLFLIEV